MCDTNNFLDSASVGGQTALVGVTGGAAANGHNNNNNELQAILSPASEEICLLRDSPFRILRVSGRFYSRMFDLFYRSAPFVLLKALSQCVRLVIYIVSLNFALFILIISIIDT